MKKFETPDIDVLEFSVTDVIANSIGGPNDENAGESDNF